ncbi:hypothetical protein ACWCW7_35145 [Nocardia tengchongensis]
MTERKTPAAKAAAAPAETIGRFYELQKEVSAPQPYVLTSTISIGPLTRRQFVAMERAVGDEAEQERILFGENYDAIIELFADQPYEVWREFTVEINRHLFGLSVEEAPGKSEESSSS